MLTIKSEINKTESVKLNYTVSLKSIFSLAHGNTKRVPDVLASSPRQPLGVISQQ